MQIAATLLLDPPLLPRPQLRVRFWNDLRFLWALALLPHIVSIGVSAVLISHGHGRGNLINFLGAAHQMVLGKDIYARDPVYGGDGGYVYPPLIAFLYQPLTMVSLKSAAFVSLAINGIVSVFTLILVSHTLVERLTARFDPRLAAQVAIFGALCTFDKIKGELSLLETNVFMLLAFTAAMRWVDRRPWLSGLALGFAFDIKYLPLVLIPYLLLRRRFAAVGWFFVFAIAFAILPATTMGWHANLHAWSQASAGLLRLFGIHVTTDHAAHVRLISDNVSISLSSGVARIIHSNKSLPLLISGCIGAIFAGYALLVYRMHRVPILGWPGVALQARPPYRGLLSIEWMGMLLMMLIFSPFTNSRHLYMMMDINIAAGVLLLGTRGLVNRWPLIIGSVLMALGITFPPGGMASMERADHFWRFIGGPGWSMLLMYTTLIWTNVKFQRAQFDSNPA
jgi:Glycosyltransferase family 87